MTRVSADERTATVQNNDHRELTRVGETHHA
jgi:hypothetical protein